MRNFIRSPGNQKKQLRFALIGSLLLAACVFLLNDDLLLPSSDGLFESRRTLTESEVSVNVDADADVDATTTKPIIHTFFEDMSESGNGNVLVDAWKEEWEAIGFETKVLTMEDAKSHPDYEKMKETIDPILGDDLYNKLCFYRWIAMAAQESGGFMSDYDTFPTNFPIEEGTNLPNEGNFTSFELHVPSLMSGSRDEWNRVAALLIEAIPRTDNTVKSDMYTFQTLREEGTHDILFLPPPYNMKRGFIYLEPGTIDCREMGLGRAVHISHWKTHEAFDNGKYPLMDMVEEGTRRPSDEQRAAGAKKFLKDWREQCGGSKVATKVA